MVFISLGLFIYKNHASQINGMLNKTVGGNFSYMRLDSKPASASASGESLLPLNVRNLANLSLVKRLLPSAFLILCIGMQTVLSSALWNYSLITFSNILETDTLTGEKKMNKQLSHKLSDRL